MRYDNYFANSIAAVIVSLVPVPEYVLSTTSRSGGYQAHPKDWLETKDRLQWFSNVLGQGPQSNVLGRDGQFYKNAL